MRALIVEDEVVAAQVLETLVGKLYPEIEILAVTQSVSETVEWLREHPMPDLIFMDIHLSDDSSFAIFEQVKITCPVIFTTAYDEYALKAFEVNSIDYLLKPIAEKDLQRAVGKYKNLSVPASDSQGLIEKLVESFRQNHKSYKSNLLVSKKDSLIPLPVREIAYIYIEEKTVTAVTGDNRNFVLDQTMEELAEALDPDLFFRANRQYIVARGAIRNASLWFGNKLSVNLAVQTPDRIVVSKARAREFKAWLSD